MKFRSMAINTHIGVAVLFLLGSRILQCDAVTITSEGSLDGRWKFKEGSAVTLNCTINSYGNGMTWKFDSTVVAQCTPQICVPILLGDGAFAFGYDIINTEKKFYWTINPVKMAHHGKVFECSNGTVYSNFTATVQANKASPADTIGIVALVFALVGSVVALLISTIYICCMHCKCCKAASKKIEDGNELKTRVDQQIVQKYPLILEDQAHVKDCVKKHTKWIMQQIFIEQMLVQRLVDNHISTKYPDLSKGMTQVHTDEEATRFIRQILSNIRDGE